MAKRSILVAAMMASLLPACGSGGGGNATGSGGQAGSSSGTGAGGTTSSGGGMGGMGGAGGATTGPGGMGGTGGATSGEPTAADLLAKVASCNQVSNGLYTTDSDSGSATVAICGLEGAVFWTADMDVDCDGKTTTACNINTDPAYQNETSATDSNGDPLDAAALPYVVVPLPSSRFDYGASGLQLGSVIAVIYKGQLTYGVFGDEGPDDIIGEASYAMAKSLGIDPDPSFGGTDGPVTYIAFTGDSAVVSPIEDHAAALAVGKARAKQLLQEN